MSNRYTVGDGDTFELISRRAYGTAAHAGAIARANPGAAEPLTSGAVLVLPEIPGSPIDKRTPAASSDPNEVALLIDGERFRFWSGLQIRRSLDNQDAVGFSAPFDPDAPGFREAFRPFSYKNIDITVGGAPLFAGTLVDIVPTLTAAENTLQVSGYARPGVLADCTPPASAFPLEFDNSTLTAIAAKLCEPFGLSVVADGSVGATFERVAIMPGDKILAFLAGLARQRGLVLSSTPTGALLIQTAGTADTPAAVLTEGASPVLSVLPAFSPQEYYSHVTGIEDTILGLKGSKYTVRNPHLSGVLRPLTFESPDVETGDLKTSTDAKVGRMFGNMASYTVAVDTWRTANGELWSPNTTVLLTAPGAMVYEAYAFTVRAVTFARDADKEAAELELVLPGSFSGQTPEAVPWA